MVSHGDSNRGATAGESGGNYDQNGSLDTVAAQPDSSHQGNRRAGNEEIVLDRPWRRSIHDITVLA